MNSLCTTGIHSLRHNTVTSCIVDGLFSCLLAFGILALVGDALSSAWYVRPSSSGTADGNNWNNAWSIPNLNANWGKVSAGDTIWLSGGTYTSGINFTKS